LRSLLESAEAKLNEARSKSGQQAINLLSDAQNLIDQAKDALRGSHGKP